MKHLIFYIVDHFEPVDAEQITDWIEQFERLQATHHDSYGNSPKITWFYWDEKPAELAALRAGVERDLGEIEIHLHHENDSSDSLRAKLLARLEKYAAFGLRKANLKARYGFIHGFWALDNSAGGKHCGVNDELTVLKETGCYADFTFPAYGTMQPSFTNKIYYATDDPSRPKSYDTGTPVQVNREAQGDLMIVQGPGHRSGYSKFCSVRPLNWILERTRVYTDITCDARATPVRIRNWVKSNVSVVDKEDWVFVKCHQHGARRRDYDSFFGKAAERMYQTLETEYGASDEWSLHYVTAREAYNMIKAAEDGEVGDPEEYRNYAITPYS